MLKMIMCVVSCAHMYISKHLQLHAFRLNYYPQLAAKPWWIPYIYREIYRERERESMIILCYWPLNCINTFGSKIIKDM